MPAPVAPPTARLATRCLVTATAAFALFLLLAASASAQPHPTTYEAVVSPASTTDPADWYPSGVPQNGDTIIIPRDNQVLSIDADIVLDGLRIGPDVAAPIIRLTGAVRASVGSSQGIPLVLRNASILGTAGQGNVFTFTHGATIEGSLRLGNGVSIDVNSHNGADGLTFNGGNINFVGAVLGKPTPAIRLHHGESGVRGPLTVVGLDSAIRPAFSVEEHARLRFTGNANVGAPLVTEFHGTVAVEGGATVGRLEGDGSLDVRTGPTSQVVTLGSAALQNADVDFFQGPHGFFPKLGSAMPIEVEGSRIRTVADGTADQAAAQQQQQLVAPFTPTGGLDNRYDPGRIDRGSAWTPSVLEFRELVADRRVLARKEPVPGEEPPKPARLRSGANASAGTDLVCEQGDYNHAVSNPGTVGTFYRDGVEIAARVPSYRLTAADYGHAITCAALVIDVYGNEIDDPAVGSVTAVLPAEPVTPNDPGTPADPTTPATPQTPSSPTAETPAAATTPVAPSAPTGSAATATTPAPAATPAAATTPRVTRTVAAAVPAIAAAATTPARCPTVAELTDVSSAWKLAASAKSQATLTGSATPGVWRCSVTGTENGAPVVVRSLPVLVANKQRAMLTSESARTPELRNPTLMSSGTQRISARLYARGGDAKLKTRTTRFTQTVRKGANTLRFTQTVGASLPKGRYKLVVRAITADGVSAPLVQEVTIG